MSINESIRDKSRIGTAVIVEVGRGRHIDEATKTRLDFMEFPGGMATVVPCGMFKQGERGIFIPAGNVAPDHPHYDWLGAGRKRVIRNRKFLGKYTSTGILAPLSVLPEDFHRWNDSVIGRNVATTLGVFHPVPPQPSKIKASKQYKLTNDKIPSFCASLDGGIKLDDRGGLLVDPVRVTEDQKKFIKYNAKQIIMYLDSLRREERSKQEQANNKLRRYCIDFLAWAYTLGAVFHTDGKDIYATQEWHDKANDDAKAILKEHKPVFVKLIQEEQEKAQRAFDEYQNSQKRAQTMDKLTPMLEAQAAADIKKWENRPQRDHQDMSAGPLVALRDENNELRRSITEYQRAHARISEKCLAHDKKWEVLAKVLRDRFGFVVENGDVPSAVIGTMAALELKLAKLAKVTSQYAKITDPVLAAFLSGKFRLA